MPPETVKQASEKNSSNWAILKFAPIYEWISLGILTSMMIIVGWSVELAGWGDLPSVIPTLVIGTITAFVISRLSIHPFLVSILVILLGILIVIWQASAQAVGDNPITRAIDSVVRMVSWVNVAQSGGISTDTIPFALMFMTAAWIVGYTVTVAEKEQIRDLIRQQVQSYRREQDNRTQLTTKYNIQNRLGRLSSLAYLV